MLARYSGEWTVLRELLQNAADASASKVTIKFETLPSSTVPVPQTVSPSALLRHTLLHHTLKRLLVINNGQPFGPNDWSRLKRIAEGNPDETKIGAFGVGFYSVFADCEEPFVSSGKEAMAFYWKGNSLFTRRLQLPDEQSSPDTSFVLDYRNTTSPVPSLLPLSQFLASAMTFVGITNIDLWLDDWKLLSLKKLTAPALDVVIPSTIIRKTSEGLMRIESVTREMAQLDASWLNIIAWKPKVTPGSLGMSSAPDTTKGAHSSQSLRTFFSRFSAFPSSATSVTEKLAREEQEAQNAIVDDLMGESTATVFLHVNTASIRTACTKSFSQELERATKKPPPALTKLAVLTSSFDEKTASVSSETGIASKATDIFGSVLPSKSGRIFIGFPTHQTTSLNAHISAPSVIPTVERESIDLQARWIRTWNMEMLRAAGIVCRVAWSGEIEAVKEKLNSTLARDKRTKITTEDITAVLLETIHTLNQFTFHESTPSSQVGSAIEESFWTCSQGATIEILSTRGILPSQQVRLAVDDLSFVEGIPVLPQLLVSQADGFIKRLTDFGVITEITTADIKTALEAQALNSKQLTAFLGWLGHKAQINEVDAPMVKKLLDVTVANDDSSPEGSSRLLVLSDIKHFINPSKIPANIPIPLNTMPFHITKNLERIYLEALGWEDLQIVPWLRWLIENVGGRGHLSIDQDLTQSPAFAGQVLPIISKQWDGLSASSKNSVMELMKSRTVIPTKMGMKIPAQSYFPSVNLFDDLPVVNLHSVKEKILLAFGVRKTVDLELIFQRLLAPPDYSTDASSSRPTWNHVDLIKYFTKIRSDIPETDVKRLRNTPICPAESKDPTKATNQLYLVSELFEPNDTLRSLGLKLLYWPGVFRPSNDESKFLNYLGLRNSPQVPELVSIMGKAVTIGDIPMRDLALKYFLDHHHINGYSNFDVGTSITAFLPIEGGDPKKAVLPGQCFANQGAAILDYDILRKDLHTHGNRLGVRTNPPIEDCINRLIADPPDPGRRARDVFGYFATRLNELDTWSIDRLSKALIVPVMPKKPLHHTPASEKSGHHRYISPNNVFLGNIGRYADIFDYADFGQEANSFLLRCGSKHEPTTTEIGQLVVREPARIFNVIQVDGYMDLLRSLADSWSHLKLNKSLVKEMKSASFLLAYKEYVPEHGKRQLKSSDLTGIAQETADEEEPGVRHYQLTNASQAIIVDEVLSYNLFKGHFIAAPMEERLEIFYEKLGAPTLSSLVDEKVDPGRKASDQGAALKLQKLVHERAKLFLHGESAEQIKHDVSWLERHVTFVCVQSLSIRTSLKTMHISHTKHTTAASDYDSHRGWILYFTLARQDLFDVSQALLQFLIARPKAQHAMMLEMLLSTDLLKLKQRGYNVDRILHLKQAEARVAEEQRQAQLQAEEQRIKEQEAMLRESQARDAQNQILMPGVFPDSPDHKSDSSSSAPVDILSRGHRGLFAGITRRLGIDDGRRHSQADGMGESSQAPPPPYSQGDNERAHTPSQPPRPITAPHHLQQNLLNAVQASRAHNSRSIVSQPKVNEVKETSTYCDNKPAQNITFFGDTSSGVKIFLSNNMSDKYKFVAENASALNAFTLVLLDCAEAFSLAKSAVHVFHEENSSTIAFNQNKSLFFNYHYFENLHLPAVQQGNKADALIYWFVVFCHELAHNLVGDHSSEHSYYVESFVIQFFAKIVRKIARVSSESASASTDRPSITDSATPALPPHPMLRPNT